MCICRICPLAYMHIYVLNKNSLLFIYMDGVITRQQTNKPVIKKEVKVIKIQINF